MLAFLLSAVLLIILPAGGSSQHHRPDIPNAVVVQKDLRSTAEVTLHCGDAAQGPGMNVRWRRDGILLPQQGNQINVTVAETMGGDFTCHDDTGAVLSRQLVLVQLIQTEEKPRKILETNTDGEHIECFSRNYSGTFHCSWKWSSGREKDGVHVVAKRSSGRDNITCTVDEDKSGVTCVDQLQCVFAEELDYIDLSVSIRSVYRLEEHTKQFCISDIVKPDKIGIAKVNGNTFEIEYPSTWNAPESYFPLTFHFKVMPLGKGWDCSHDRIPGSHTRNRTISVGNRKEFRLCVRAKDELCPSSWSEWSHYEVKRR